MSHLTGFGLENFRVFKDYTWFDFAPITILVGPNNSGKSSLTKALLLLQDNVTTGNLPPSFESIAEGYSHSYPSGEIDYSDFNEVFKASELDFNDRVHGLNNATSAKSYSSDKNELNFDIPFGVMTCFHKKMTGKQVFGSDFRPVNDQFFGENRKLNTELSNSGIAGLVDRIGLDNWNDKLAFPLMKQFRYRLSFKVNENTSAIHKVEIRDENLNLILTITANTVYFDAELYVTSIGDYDTIAGPFNEYDNYVSASHSISFKSWFLENNFSEEQAKDISKKILKNLGLTESGIKIDSSVMNFLKSIDSFSTSWTELRRVYTEDDSSKTTRQLLNLIAQQKKGFNLRSFFESYADYFGIQGIPDVDYDKTKGVLFPNISGESFLSFGYGYSQIASLLFKIAIHITQKFTLIPGNELFFGGDNTILILEEPETNLHPSFQSKMANLIAGTSSEYKIQYLIETHSEYLIRKFQYLIAKGEMKSEDVVIHYFNDPKSIPPGEKQVKKITILEDGNLSDDFGTGFFDEASHWELELLKIKHNKNRKN